MSNNTYLWEDQGATVPYEFGLVYLAAPLHDAVYASSFAPTVPISETSIHNIKDIPFSSTS